ncbi:MAG: FAD/NAD(P)-binding protein, partial [Sphingomicrobium sp.]
TGDPLLRGLLDAGAIEPDALGIGLELGEGNRVAGNERLWAMGALTKGRYWEITAVPDIRHQAAQIAAEIAEEIGHD